MKKFRVALCVCLFIPSVVLGCISVNSMASVAEKKSKILDLDVKISNELMPSNLYVTDFDGIMSEIIKLPDLDNVTNIFSLDIDTLEVISEVDSSSVSKDETCILEFYLDSSNREQTLAGIINSKLLVSQVSIDSQIVLRVYMRGGTV